MSNYLEYSIFARFLHFQRVFNIFFLDRLSGELLINLFGRYLIELLKEFELQIF